MNSKGKVIIKLPYQANSIETVVEEQIHETQYHKYVDQDDDDNNHNSYSIDTYMRDMTEAMHQPQSKNKLRERDDYTNTSIERVKLFKIYLSIFITQCELSV